eukprot:gene25787-11454_t
MLLEAGPTEPELAAALVYRMEKKKILTSVLTGLGVSASKVGNIGYAGISIPVKTGSKGFGSNKVGSRS